MTDTARVQATFCATVVDEWRRAGAPLHAVVCPGSRCTPVALALADAAEADPGAVVVHVHHDERSAGFMALGVGRATGRPAVVVTTSGTAAAELHAAVAEADAAGVPMLVCTADRPRHLWAVGAPQTMDQTHLYGGAVRWFVEPGVADAARAGTWRSLAARAWLAATGDLPGPVHLNLELDEPLVAEPGPLPAGRERGGDAWHRSYRPGDETSAPLPDQRLLAVEHGVIVAGGVEVDPAAAHRLSAATGWPVLADPRSGARTPDVHTVAAFDPILRVDEFAAAHRPAVVLQLGPPPASKVLADWLAALEAEHVVVSPVRRWPDPGRTAETLVVDDPTAFCRRWAAAGESERTTDWTRSWRRAETAAQGAIAEVLDAEWSPTEPGIARTLVDGLDDGTTLVVSSSMPVRDVEWFSAPRTGVRVLANRGVNGIDGVVSTAVGVAAAGGRVVALVGDVAFLHDSNALLGLAGRGLDLTTVVVDNDGGGIFEFLPQARSLPRARFERLFGTPHGVDLGALSTVHGLRVAEIALISELSAAAATADVVVARTRRDENVALHERLLAAVAAAVRA